RRACPPSRRARRRRRPSTPPGRRRTRPGGTGERPTWRPTGPWPGPTRPTRRVGRVCRAGGARASTWGRPPAGGEGGVDQKTSGGDGRNRNGDDAAPLAVCTSGQRGVVTVSRPAALPLTLRGGRGDVYENGSDRQSKPGQDVLAIKRVRLGEGGELVRRGVN